MSPTAGRHVAVWLVAGIAGAVAFWLVQVLAGGPTISAFMGEQIVAAGGYPGSSAPFVGWAVHLAVSLSYALLLALVTVAVRRASLAAMAITTLLAALALGWATAVIAPPAISVAIGLLSGRGWPDELFPLNFTLGLPLWNHLLFFLLNWVIQIAGRRFLTR